MSKDNEKPDNVISFPAVKAMAGNRDSWFKVKNEAESSFEIWIDDIIDETWGYGSKEFMNSVSAHDAEGKTAIFRINSDGGSVFTGYVIANFIKNMKSKTVAHIDGLAASIASVIATACDEVRMPKNSMMMIHEAESGVWGRASDLRNVADLVEKINGQIAQHYQDKRAATLGTDVEGEDFLALMKETSWLTAEEAVALGLANEITDEVKVAACISKEFADVYKNVPENVVIVDETHEEQDDDFVEDLSDEEQSEIKTACDAMNMSEKAEGFIQNKTNINDVRAALIDARAKNQEQIDTTQSAAPVADPNAAAQARARANAIAVLNSQSLHNKTRKNTK